MNVLLDVPYSQKDLAKQKGAKWNADLKTWFIDDFSKIIDVNQWMPHNIVCENLYVLKMKQTCWSCNESTDVVLFATDKSYASNDYKINDNIQILTYVTNMPTCLKTYMMQSLYFPSRSSTIGEKYYVNHCVHCRKIQGDNFLHEEPQQSFYKHLLYKNMQPIEYAKINNNFCIPLQAVLPGYDEVSRSLDLDLAHMNTGIENRASRKVNQQLINSLFDSSVRLPDILISGI